MLNEVFTTSANDKFEKEHEPDDSNTYEFITMRYVRSQLEVNDLSPTVPGRILRKTTTN